MVEGNHQMQWMTRKRLAKPLGGAHELRAQ
jgi:hypothetical protein